MRAEHGTAGRQILMGGSSTARRRAATAALAIAASALLLGACSSSSSSSTTTSTKAGATTSAPTSTSTTPASTTTSGPKTTGCTTPNLAITLGIPNGSAGAIHYGITFHNAGASTCTLFGYPGVSFLAGATQIGAPAQREGNLTPGTVTLASGGNAYSSVAVTDPGIPPCSSSATATQVRIFPPGETHAALVAAPSGGIAVCSSPNTANYLSAIITPVAATDF